MNRREGTPLISVQRKGGRVIVSGSRTDFFVEAPRNGVRPKDIAGIDRGIRAKTNRISDVQLARMSNDVSDVLTYLMRRNTGKVARGTIGLGLVALGILGSMSYSVLHIDPERPLISLFSVTGEGLAGIFYAGIAAKRSQSLSLATQQLGELSISVAERLKSRLQRPVYPRTSVTEAKYN